MTRNKIIITLAIALAAVSLGLILSRSTTPLTPTPLQLRGAGLPSPHSAIAPWGEGQIFHYSTLMGQKFYDRAYDEASTIVKTDEPIAGGTVNHHLLAAPLDAQFFQGLAAQKPKRIILIGPDHMGRGRQPITTTAGTWRTPYGDLTTDTALISKLAEQKLVNMEESPFDYEFSVGGLVPFIKRSLPEALTTTIIVRIDTTDEELDALADALPTDKDTIVVGSVDFSHYLPSRAAEFHDITNRTVLNAFDFPNFDKIEVDSPPTLRILLKYLERRSAETATLVANTDSAKITGQLDLQEGTSYLNQYFSMGEKTPLNVATSLYLNGTKKITAPEDRFMRGFMSLDDGSMLPQELKKPGLAVGIARYADRTVYYLFPTVVEKGTRRLMTAAEERSYFRQNNIKERIVTYNN